MLPDLDKRAIKLANTIIGASFKDYVPTSDQDTGGDFLLDGRWLFPLMGCDSLHWMRTDLAYTLNNLIRSNQAQQEELLNLVEPDLTYLCDICTTRRGENDIRVHQRDVSKHFGHKPGTVYESIKYCAEDPECRLGAQTFSHVENGIAPPDAIAREPSEDE